MKREHFGNLPNGQAVDIVTLESETARCRIISYGASLVSLEVPDKNGNLVDVLLGYDTLEDYICHGKFMGAVVGRYANRIGGGRFTLDGTEYTLFSNERTNHLHGGKHGFDKYVWTVEEIPNGARFSMESPHMDEGYPGKLTVTVDYTLVDSTLTLDYRAQSDRNTVCNLTNHAYFNLDGHNAGTILDHELTLFSDFYTPVSDNFCITTGEIAPVSGTPLDFTTATPIGQRIDEDFPQLNFGGGYDLNWVVRGKIGELRPAALVHSSKTGISMEVETDLPGIQFYTGNYLGTGPLGKGGISYPKRAGLCLETQFYPDSPNKPQFPSPVLKAGEPWIYRTIFKFCK